MASVFAQLGLPSPYAALLPPAGRSAEPPAAEKARVSVSTVRSWPRFVVPRSESDAAPQTSQRSLGVVPTNVVAPLTPAFGLVAALSAARAHGEGGAAWQSAHMGAAGMSAAGMAALRPASDAVLYQQHRKRREQFLTAMEAHAEAFVTFFRIAHETRARLAAAVRQKVVSLRKARELAASRVQRAELATLRSTDKAAYDQLVAKARSERIQHLMAQTEAYLESLTNLVSAQRQATEQKEKEHAERAAKASQRGAAPPVPAAHTHTHTHAHARGDADAADASTTTPAPDDAVTPSGPRSGHHASWASAAAAGAADTDVVPSDADAFGDVRSDAEGAAPGEAAAVELPFAAPGSRDVMEQYYRLAHQRTERIHEQPRMLVGGALKSYQLAGVEWMVSLYNNHLNGILADEMGLGKTVQTVALFTYLVEVKRNEGPFMVAVPLSTLSNWSNEFMRWAPSLVVVRYKGTPGQRKDVYRRQVAGAKYHVLLTTYEYAMRDKRQLSKIHWQYIVVDEGHRLKNAHCRFTQVLGQEYTSRNRLLLTGTPLQNSLPELWSLLNFLLPRVFNSSQSFEQWFSKPFASFRASVRLEDGAEADSGALSREEQLIVMNRLHQVLRPFLLRRLKSQVLSQLPEKTERVVRCELSAWQRIIYRQIQRYGRVATEESSGADASVLGSSKGLNGLLVQLRKAVNHPYLFVNSYSIDDMIWRASGKFDVLDRMLPKLQRTGHRVLIFSQHTQLMDIMGDFLTYRGFVFLRLDGSTSPTEREERMQLFNAPDSPYFIFLLSTRAGGLGINLATADTVVIFDSDWNPTADAQAQDRAHRIGQTREVRVFRLVTLTPVEERILAKAQDKSSMEALVIEAGQFYSDLGADALGADTTTSAEERKKMLESLLAAELDSGEGPAAAEQSAAPDDEEMNEMLARDEAELDTFTRMDTERALVERYLYAGGGSTGAVAATASRSASHHERGRRPARSPVEDTSELDDGAAREGDDMDARADVDEADGDAVADAVQAAREQAYYNRLLREEEVPAWVKVGEEQLAAHLTKRQKQSMSQNLTSTLSLAADADDAAKQADGDKRKRRRELDNLESVAVEDGGARRARARMSTISAQDALTEHELMKLADQHEDPEAFAAAVQAAAQRKQMLREARAARKGLLAEPSGTPQAAPRGRASRGRGFRGRAVAPGRVRGDRVDDDDAADSESPQRHRVVRSRDSSVSSSDSASSAPRARRARVSAVPLRRSSRRPVDGHPQSASSTPARRSLRPRTARPIAVDSDVDDDDIDEDDDGDEPSAEEDRDGSDGDVEED